MSFELSDSSDECLFRRTGVRTSFCTLPSGHAAISIVEFVPSGWAPPAFGPAAAGNNPAADAQSDAVREYMASLAQPVP
eukprot:7216115-Heterocapsa_arctica.AAC.1